MMEGQTEKVFLSQLRLFLESRLKQSMPKLVPDIYHGRIPTQGTLKRRVELLLADSKRPADAVIALTDVYTGTKEFIDAADAQSKMTQWVGENSRFFPHVALHDFEAWLLPYWEEICELAGSNRSAPSPHPESVNHSKPPSYRISEVFRTGSRGRKYVKTRDAKRILEDKDLAIAAQACPELKAFLNRILTLCGGTLLS
jgi:Domain of unknown function (DUF4276)